PWSPVPARTCWSTRGCRSRPRAPGTCSLRASLRACCAGFRSSRRRPGLTSWYWRHCGTPTAPDAASSCCRPPTTGCDAAGLAAPYPHRQALEEVAQQLVAARTVIAVPGLAEQRRHLRLGHGVPRVGKDPVHVDVGQLERHPQLLQHDVVADALLH